MSSRVRHHASVVDAKLVRACGKKAKTSLDFLKWRKFSWRVGAVKFEKLRRPRLEITRSASFHFSPGLVLRAREVHSASAYSSSSFQRTLRRLAPCAFECIVGVGRIELQRRCQLGMEAGVGS